MKKKRYLPFGYQMNEGNIIPDILESSAVQSIFENYRNGASLQMLAKQMQQSGLKYRENAVWNKAMIARILDCEKYISEEFPAILPSDLFLQVQSLRKDSAQIQPCEEYEILSAARPADRSLFESIIEIMYISSGNALPAIRKQGICPT